MEAGEGALLPTCRHIGELCLPSTAGETGKLFKVSLIVETQIRICCTGTYIVCVCVCVCLCACLRGEGRDRESFSECLTVADRDIEPERNFIRDIHFHCRNT